MAQGESHAHSYNESGRQGATDTRHETRTNRLFFVFALLPEKDRTWFIPRYVGKKEK